MPTKNIYVSREDLHIFERAKELAGESLSSIIVEALQRYVEQKEKEAKQRVIVTRHPATVEFIREVAPEFADAPVISSATPDDVRGKIVAGNLPLHLAALAAEVWAVEFEEQPPRGQEYSLEDMKAAGAVLRRYKVQALNGRA